MALDRWITLTSYRCQHIQLLAYFVGCVQLCFDLAVRSYPDRRSATEYRTARVGQHKSARAAIQVVFHDSDEAVAFEWL